MADRLDFEIDTALETGLITGHAGVPGLIEAFRLTGTAAVIDREVKLKQRKRGLSASGMVESLLALWAAGGERGGPFAPGETSLLRQLDCHGEGLRFPCRGEDRPFLVARQ